MRDFRELNQQLNEVKGILNSFIQKLTAQVEMFMGISSQTRFRGTMRRSIIFNISGILIIIFWVFILVELGKRVNCKSRPINTHRIYGQRNVEDLSEDWMDILLKGHKIGYAVTKIKKIHSGFEVSEKIFVVINLSGYALYSTDYKM